VQYTTAPVTRGDIVKAVTATGTVNPVLTIIVGTYVSGVIQELFCDYNTKVKKGQLCAKIDPRPYQTIVDQDRANLGVAKAQLVKDQASLAYAKLNWERNGTLAKLGWVSQDTADSAKSTYDQAQAQTEVDRATIKQREAELATAEVNLGYTDIVSPVDGTVVSRNVTMGQTVAASFQTPTLFLIATDLTQMEVDTNVSESDVGAVKEGNQATFTVESFPNRTFSGKVVQVRQAPQSIQNVVTYDVVVGVPNPDLSLMPGMTATTRITTQERHDVLRVPDQALRYTPGGLASARPAPGAPSATGRAGQVWVLRDGRPVRVPVTLGLDDDSFTEIVSGDLTAGEPVIVSQQQGAAGGTRPTAPPALHL
jgi:HlyD family secretion protein